MTLFTGAGLALSVGAVGRGSGFAAVEAMFVGAALVEVVVAGAEVAAGLSTLVLEVSLEFI